MAEPIIIDGEGFELDADSHERVEVDGENVQHTLNDEGQFLDPETGEVKLNDEQEALTAKLYEPEEENPTMTLEEAVAKIAEQDTSISDLTKSRDGIANDLSEERGRRRQAEHVTQPAGMTPEQEQEWLAEPLTHQEALTLQGEVRQYAAGVTRPLIQKISLRAAKEAHEDFDEVSKLADEIFAKDATAKAVAESSSDPSEAKYKVGQTHPTWIAKIKETSKAEGKKEVTEKIGKTTVPTAANLTGKTKVDLSNIDLAAAAKLQKTNPEAFAKLPLATRERIMGAV